MNTIEKPSGLHVFAPHADPEGDCLARRLIASQPWRAEVAWPDGFAGGIAHRLDGPTSGAVWVADDLDELAQMRAWFAAGLLVKTYRFEASKDVPWSRHAVDRPIAHDRARVARMVVQRGAETPHRGRWFPAHTEVERVAGRLWEARITTGVTHQIRVHAAFLGLALRGDRLYGGGAPLDGPAPFRLHHVGLVGPGGVATAPVPLPAWADPMG